MTLTLFFFFFAFFCTWKFLFESSIAYHKSIS